MKRSRPPTSLAKKLKLEAGGLSQWRQPSHEKAVEVYAPFMDLISKMLIYQPSERITPAKALEHRFIVEPPAGSGKKGSGSGEEDDSSSSGQVSPKPDKGS